MINLGMVIFYFIILWWIFVVLFSLVMMYSWGTEMMNLRNFNNAMGSVLGQIVMSSNQPQILHYEKEAIDQAEFYILIIVITYTLKMCIVC